MKLILTRHAKSSWDDLSVDDHDRPLNARGSTSASAIGGWLQTQGHGPATLLCSTATRARQTCDLIEAELTQKPRVMLETGLYHATSDSILRCIQRMPDGPLMLVGHNPGFAELATLLLKTAPGHGDFRRYPTAATMVCDMPGDTWRDIAVGTGTLLAFVTPREVTP